VTVLTAIERRPLIWMVSAPRIATSDPGAGSAGRVGADGVGLGVGDTDGEGSGELLGWGDGL